MIGAPFDPVDAILAWGGELALLPEGERPRTVQQLLAAGKIRLRKGQYVLAK